SAYSDGVSGMGTIRGVDDIPVDRSILTDSDRATLAALEAGDISKLPGSVTSLDDLSPELGYHLLMDEPLFAHAVANDPKLLGVMLRLQPEGSVDTPQLLIDIASQLVPDGDRAITESTAAQRTRPIAYGEALNDGLGLRGRFGGAVERGRASDVLYRMSNFHSRSEWELLAPVFAERLNRDIPAAGKLSRADRAELVALSRRSTGNQAVAFADYEISGLGAERVTGRAKTTNPDVVVDERGFGLVGNHKNHDRYTDAEAQVLESIAARIEHGLDSGELQQPVFGRLRLRIDKPSCYSCQNAIMAFQRRYPGIELDIATGGPRGVR
ncbi:MAG: hypothetical protein AAF658_07405, partial [Myxococcota bacterium]